MEVFIYIGLFIVLLYIIGLVRTTYTIKSHWHYSLANFKFSVEDFYKSIVERIEQQEVPGVKFERERFKESHVLSGKREYLRVSWKEYAFYINGSHLGTGSFASWWLCIKNEKPLNKIPILNKLLGKDRSNKTFYQDDTAAMYRQLVHHVVTEVINHMTEEKGLRPLTELEKQIVHGHGKS